MALDRLLPVSTTPGTISGDSYMDAVQEEVTGLWDRATITLTGVAGTDTITATATPALTGALGGSMNFILKPAATNTGAVTLNINASGAVAVVDAEGSALTAGALRINANYLLHYDSGIAKFVVVGYTPAANVQVGSKLLATVVPLLNASTFDFVNGLAPSSSSGTVTASGTVVLDDTYDSYELDLANLKPATNDVELWLRVGTGAGPTYQTTLYQHVADVLDDSGATNNVSSSSDAKIILGTRSSAGNKVGNAASRSISGTITFHNPDDGSFNKLFTFQTAYLSATGANFNTGRGGGSRASVTALTAIRIMFDSGNIASGRATLYGKTKS